ncbi:hypothetical protein BC828DRAFT_16600 [Blastocladiella britannica]|nr:hypothetical protein BC828DRAFT_16600 [Blastocladiella britannica]
MFVLFLNCERSVNGENGPWASRLFSDLPLFVLLALPADAAPHLRRLASAAPWRISWCCRPRHLSSSPPVVAPQHRSYVGRNDDDTAPVGAGSSAAPPRMGHVHGRREGVWLARRVGHIPKQTGALFGALLSLFVPTTLTCPTSRFQ